MEKVVEIVQVVGTVAFLAQDLWEATSVVKGRSTVDLENEEKEVEHVAAAPKPPSKASAPPKPAAPVPAQPPATATPKVSPTTVGNSNGATAGAPATAVSPQQRGREFIVQFDEKKGTFSSVKLDGNKVQR